MFQPDQSALVAWTSASLCGDGLRGPDSGHARQTIARSTTRKPGPARSLALATGLAILLLVLALALLRTSSPNSVYAVVAVLPAFRSLNLAQSRRDIAADSRPRFVRHTPASVVKENAK
jgi:hypothetical protein